MPPPIKRQASDSFSGNQSLVKRQKDGADAQNGSSALVVGRGSTAQSGTLVQSVSIYMQST